MRLKNVEGLEESKESLGKKEKRKTVRFEYELYSAIRKYAEEKGIDDSKAIRVLIEKGLNEEKMPQLPMF